MDDIRWFSSNAYTRLVVPELQNAGLTVATEGDAGARVAFAMSGRSAEAAWRYAFERKCPLIIYLWDLPPRGTGTGTPDPVWWVAGRFLRLPRIFNGYPQRRGYYSRLRFIARRADAVWTPSGMTAEVVSRRFGVESLRVPYCYDSTRFRPAAVERDQPPTLLTVSRLEAHKNQAAVIRAAASLGRDVQIRLIGRGPESERLTNLAGELGVKLRLETDASDATVTEAYRTARVVVCPSRFEGFGLTPVEAVASGTPVAVSDIPPHRESVGSCGFFFRLDDAAGLRAAVAAALDAAPPGADSVEEFTIERAGERFSSALHATDLLHGGKSREGRATDLLHTPATPE